MDNFISEKAIYNGHLLKSILDKHLIKFKNLGCEEYNPYELNHAITKALTEWANEIIEVTKEKEYVKNGFFNIEPGVFEGDLTLIYSQPLIKYCSGDIKQNE